MSLKGQEMAQLVNPGENLGNIENFPVYDLPIKVVVNQIKDNLYPKETIQFRITIHNNIPGHSFSFYRTEDIFEQIFFSVKDSQGETISKTLSFNRYLLENQWNYEKKNTSEILEPRPTRDIAQQYRKIEIETGENFSFVISLDQFYSFNFADRYFAKGYFYPLGMRFNKKNGQKDFNTITDFTKANYKIAIEPFSFEIISHPFYQNNFENNDPTVISRDYQANSSSGTTDEVSYPTGVVEKHLLAIKTKKWNNYFNTLYLEKFLASTYPTTDYFERFKAAYPHEKSIVINGFKNFLIKSIDYDVVEYDILKTVIVGQQAEVEVAVTTVEPFQNLVYTRDAESGLMKEQWLSEDDKKLERKIKINFTLEEKMTVAPPVRNKEEIKIPQTKSEWKITGQTIKLLGDGAEEGNLPPVDDVGYYNEIILFSLNSFDINPVYYPFLDKLADFLITRDNIRIEIQGHTDDLADAKYNQRLSLKRANSVMEYLTSKGVSVDRMELLSFGETKPLSREATEAGRRLNRRVVIIFKENKR